MGSVSVWFISFLCSTKELVLDLGGSGGDSSSDDDDNERVSMVTERRLGDSSRSNLSDDTLAALV